MDNKIKHLEFIQGVVNRLSTNSFLLKGWSVILVSALFALSAGDANVSFVYLSYIPAGIFWGLDGYFLAVERQYRRHYDRVRGLDDTEVDFSMDLGDLRGGVRAWASATFSKTLLPFHGAILGAIVVVMRIQG